MSQENIDFVKAIYAGGEGLDKEALLAALPNFIAQTCDPEIEWVEDPGRADGRVYRGHQGVLESWEQWLEHWDEYDIEIEQVTDYGDKVLAVAVERARGAASGATVSARHYAVFSFRNGKVLRYQEFYDEAQALEAAGAAA